MNKNSNKSSHYFQFLFSQSSNHSLTANHKNGTPFSSDIIKNKILVNSLLKLSGNISKSVIPSSLSSPLTHSKFQICKSNKNTYVPLNLRESFDQTTLKRHPNLPEFLVGSSKLSELIPRLSNIRWSGTLYQESWAVSPKCHLFSANFDSRMKTGLIVRILSLCEVKEIGLNFSCQFYFNLTDDLIVTPVYEADFPGPFTNGKWMKLKPIMMACKVPVREPSTNQATPIAVSIVKKACATPTNILKIGGSLYKKNKKESNITNNNLKIGLCGKALYYYNKDFSDRLIEWIEVYRVLGISKFFLYKTPCHKNVEKVLEYYEKKGIVNITSFHFPSPYLQEGTFVRLWTVEHYQEFNAAQRMFYNDCVLRNKDDFDHLAIFDYDEIPFLRKHKNLIELMLYLRQTNKRVKDVAAVSLGWKNFYSDEYFLKRNSNVSDKLFAMKHNHRSKLNKIQYGEGNVKSIYNTDKVLYVACHYAISHKTVYPISDESIYLDRELVFTGHFNGVICGSSCNNISIEKDETLLQFHDQVSAQMKKIWEEINKENGKMLKN